MTLSKYLNFLNEQYGVATKTPVQRPQAGRPTYQKQTRIPKTPNNPVPPQVIKKKQVAKKKMNSNQNKEQDQYEIHQKNPKAYFNYMLWTSKILKQGEIFRKNCYEQNCSNFEIGTGDRRVCKDRCDIETCKKIIALLRASIGKCKDSVDPQKCKVRYMQLIPLYQEKLNKISKKYIEAQKQEKKAKVQVG